MTRRVALITGCGKRDGIGAATARAFAAAGIAVMVSELPGLPVTADGWRGLDSLVEEISASGGTAAATYGDVTAEADAARMVAETLATHGRLDILFNNAGAPHGQERAPIEDIPLADWERLMAINVRGAFLMARAAVPVMRRQRWGRIVNMSSVLAYAPHRQHRIAYATTKAALIGFTKSLAIDLAGDNITVNAVCPGPIRTSRSHYTANEDSGGVNTAAALTKAVEHVPLGRFGTAEEVADLVVFLASEASAWTTGQAIGITGGAHGIA